MIFVIIILAAFFTLNMGGASFAASFAASYGSKTMPRIKAAVCFMVFVVLGSVFFGKNVSFTLGQAVVPPELLTAKALIVIFFAAGISMYVSNIMKIPQSTSIVAVAAIVGVGIYFRQVEVKTLYMMVPFWIILPILSYVLTHFLTGLVYPPRKKNFWIYERFVNQQEKLKKLVIGVSCYTAFSVGTNNVANVVGPFSASFDVPMPWLLLTFGCVYGLGAFIFTGPLETAGEKIVPLGLLTASIIYFVSGSLMIFASAFGIPQSFVMLQMGAIFAVSSLKHGTESTFNNKLIQKTFYTWAINPVITLLVSFGLAWMFLK